MKQISYIILCLLFVHPAFSQSFADRLSPSKNAPTVVCVTSLDSAIALAEMTGFMVLKGYTVNLTSMNTLQFTTNPREVAVAKDLEYTVKLFHTVKLLKGNPLATLHIETSWQYAGLNNRDQIDATPAEIKEYKETYEPVYSNRIQDYIEEMLADYEHRLLTYALAE